ncbi:MAG: enoyl-CoA hydratase [Leptospiraceae bacterium]|nr:MAG: enoyl-CoA hydratase [Leptospiraceae bacterium]
MQENQDTSFFQVEKILDKKIAIIFLNRPEARNSMDWRFWSGLPIVVDELEKDDNINVIIIAAKGKSFSLGLDLVEFNERFQDIIQGKIADERKKFHELILQMQEGFRKIMQSQKVYIAAVHKHCIGGGLDLIAACDIRVGCKNAIVSLRETKVGIVADMCSLNRLPFIIGYGATKMMAFTGRDFTGEECYQMGLFEKLVEKEEDLLPETIKIAEEIAANPPIVIAGIKYLLNYMESHNTFEGMQYVALWNATYLDSADFRKIMEKFMQKLKR